MNILSSYIDGTAIYGSDETRAKELRTLSRGRILIKFFEKKIF